MMPAGTTNSVAPFGRRTQKYRGREGLGESRDVADRLVDGGVDRWARGQVNASDHAPTWIMLDL
jgi:hypothetical protein